MTHEEIHSDLSLFALGSLDPDERRVIEEHLATGCDSCQGELAIWREVVGAVALAGQEAAPPDLKPALLQRLRPTTTPPKVVPLRRWSVIVPLAAAAIAVFALALVRDAGMRRDLEQQHQLVASLQTELTSAHGNLQRVTELLATRENDVASLRTALAAAQASLAVIQAPGLQLVHLKQTPQAKPAEGHVLMSAESGRALFYAFDLPAVPPDKAYELWWISEKEGPIQAGLFHPDPNGLGRVEASVPAGVGTIQAAAVTIEPAAGVPKPSGPMVLLGSVSS